MDWPEPIWIENGSYNFEGWWGYNVYSHECIHTHYIKNKSLRFYIFSVKLPFVQEKKGGIKQVLGVYYIGFQIHPMHPESLSHGHWMGTVEPDMPGCLHWPPCLKILQLLWIALVHSHILLKCEFSGTVISSPASRGRTRNHCSGELFLQKVLPRQWPCHFIIYGKCSPPLLSSPSVNTHRSRSTLSTNDNQEFPFFPWPVDFSTVV